MESKNSRYRDASQNLCLRVTGLQQSSPRRQRLEPSARRRGATDGVLARVAVLGEEHILEPSHAQTVWRDAEAFVVQVWHRTRSLECTGHEKATASLRPLPGVDLEHRAASAALVVAHGPQLTEVS